MTERECQRRVNDGERKAEKTGWYARERERRNSAKNRTRISHVNGKGWSKRYWTGGAIRLNQEKRPTVTDKVCGHTEFWFVIFDLDASPLSEVRMLAFSLFLSFVFSRLCVLQFLYFKASWLGV